MQFTVVSSSPDLSWNYRFMLFGRGWGKGEAGGGGGGGGRNKLSCHLQVVCSGPIDMAYSYSYNDRKRDMSV